MEFTTEPVFAALTGALDLLEDGERRRAVERYLEAVRPQVDRAVFDLLAAFTAALDEGVADHYHVRLGYRPGALDLDIERREGAIGDEGLPPPPAAWGDGEMDKITMRLHAELKEEVGRAALTAGLSVNAWLVRVLASAVRNAGRNAEERDHDRRHGGGRGRGQDRDPDRDRDRDRGRPNRLSGWIGE